MNDICYRIRTIIERIPCFALIITALSIIILIPYPETITGEIKLVKFEIQEVCATGQLPYRCIKKLKEGTPVDVELEGFITKEDGMQSGYVTHIDTEIDKTPDGEVFSYTILLTNNPFMHKGMKGKVSITLPNKNLLTRAFELFEK